MENRSERRAIVVELALVGVLTFGFSAVTAILALVEMSVTGGIASTDVAMNAATSSNAAIDAVRQGMRVIKLLAIGGLGAYLLWRGGIALSSVGLGRLSRRDAVPGAGLAALIGIPGLALVATSAALGFNAHLVPAPADAAWWQIVLLCLIAVGNAVAEEVVVVAYFMTRLRQLGLAAPAVLMASAVLRGAYHLYQGIGAGVGNLVMGLVFGRWYQRTNRVWPLVIAHALIDVVAFVGYALFADRLGWLGL